MPIAEMLIAKKQKIILLVKNKIKLNFLNLKIINKTKILVLE